jgi:hypothetical protein
MVGNIPTELQHKPSPDDDPFEEKWALICVGMGDCELHYFKLTVRLGAHLERLAPFPSQHRFLFWLCVERRSW